ncbi:hypothetical protein KEM56_006664 [Ascosphaera pollenicola]|nr:hypothetical protein KEM56_006664 [Ascosphaera pollenicola]
MEFPQQIEVLQRSLQDRLLTPLHPHLQPIIARLPPQAHDFLINLLGEKCHKNIILNFDILTDPDCLVLALSKGLGLGIVTLSAIVKVPQIIKLLRSQSASGVSFVSYALETTSLLITLAYNARQKFPFSTYGESAFIAVQDIAIALLVLAFSGKKAGAGAFLAAVVGVVYALMFSGETIVDSEKMGLLQAGAGVLGVASKVPQIFTIWREGTTGQLSAFAVSSNVIYFMLCTREHMTNIPSPTQVFNYLAGSLARVFTTLQEVDDKLILYGFLAGFTFNCILAFQMFYYWNSSASVKSAAKSAKGKAKKAANAATSTVKGKSNGPQTPSKGKYSGAESKGPRTRRRG